MLQSDCTLPIERAKMRIRVIVPAADIDSLRERLLDGVDKLEHEETGDEWSGVRQAVLLSFDQPSRLYVDDADRPSTITGDI